MPDNLPEDLLKVQTEMAEFIGIHLCTISPDVDDMEFGILQTKVRQASQAAGFFYKTQPEEFGGTPASTLELTMLREMLAAANSPLSGAVFGPGPGVLHAASGVLRTDYLEPVLRGEKRGAFGFTEPDTAQRPTYAVIDGDDLLITGQKSYVTGGSTADFVSILVNVEQADARTAPLA